MTYLTNSIMISLCPPIDIGHLSYLSFKYSILMKVFWISKFFVDTKRYWGWFSRKYILEEVATYQSRVTNDW